MEEKLGSELKADDKTAPLDTLYRKVVRALDQLVDAVGLKAA